MEKAKSNKSVTKIVILCAVLAISLFIFYKIGLVDFFNDVEAFQMYIKSLGSIAYIIYILIYILVAVFFIPASVITISAGIVFGPLLGSLLSLIGATLGASIAFILSKYVCRDYIVQKFGDNEIFKKIDDGVEKNGVSFLIFTRLVPVFPYNVQNYAYGITPMKLATFAVISFITMAPGTMLYSYLAGSIVTEGISVKLLIIFCVAGVLLSLLSYLPRYFFSKKGITVDE